MHRGLLMLSLLSMAAVANAAETARDQQYGIEQTIRPVTSDIAAICEDWTQARAKACADMTQKLKQRYPTIGEQPFPLLEEQISAELKYRLALEGIVAKPEEQLVICERSTVQDPYRLNGIDLISVEEPKDKQLSPDQTNLPAGELPSSVKKKNKKRALQQKQERVLLADGKSDVTGKKGCMLDKDVQKKYGATCARPKGVGGTKEDPKTCQAGLTTIKGIPFSDEAKSQMQQGGACFKEEKGVVQKNKKTKVAEHITLASYVFCSDDADKMRDATKKDRSKKNASPDEDILEKDELSASEQPDISPGRTLGVIKERVSELLKEVMTDPDNTKILKEIFRESKQFGAQFKVEASVSEVRTRLFDYKQQLAQGVENRGHTAALYGGLCGLGESKYCTVTIRSKKN